MEEHNPGPVVTGGTGEAGEVAPTGDEHVDEALMALQRLHELPVHDHPARFDVAHRVLQDRLAADDQAEPGQSG